MDNWGVDIKVVYPIDNCVYMEDAPEKDIFQTDTNHKEYVQCGVPATSYFWWRLDGMWLLCSYCDSHRSISVTLFKKKGYDYGELSKDEATVCWVMNT